jgi:hypothetical protein
MLIPVCDTIGGADTAGSPIWSRSGTRPENIDQVHRDRRSGDGDLLARPTDHQQDATDLRQQRHEHQAQHGKVIVYTVQPSSATGISDIDPSQFFRELFGFAPIAWPVL